MKSKEGWYVSAAPGERIAVFGRGNGACIVEWEGLCRYGAGTQGGGQAWGVVPRYYESCYEDQKAKAENLLEVLDNSNSEACKVDQIILCAAAHNSNPQLLSCYAKLPMCQPLVVHMFLLLLTSISSETLGLFLSCG